LTKRTAPGLIIQGSTGRVTLEGEQVAVKCEQCGVKKGLMDVLTGDLAADRFLCQKCQDAEQRTNRLAEEAKQQAEQQRVKLIKQAAAKVIVTTTDRIDGTQVVAYLGIESVEYVIGTAIFSEVSSGIADMFGQRSIAFEE
jgi:hypothetical protein